jgi:hypothetical protein
VNLGYIAPRVRDLRYRRGERVRKHSPTPNHNLLKRSKAMTVREYISSLYLSKGPLEISYGSQTDMAGG